jgi:hypothetical protein
VDPRANATGWPPPPPIHKNLQKKIEALKYCDSNEFIELTVAFREYTYVNTKTHQNRLKPIQPN